MKDQIINILPPRICAAVEENVGENILEEIRIRRGRQAYIVASGKNTVLPIIALDSEMIKILNSITRNSLYAYKDTINKGYLTFQDLRIGIIGKAGVEADRITGVYDISEFSIRIPNKLYVNCRDLILLIKNNRHSLLIYSPPGVGKTTLLRNIIRELASGADAFRVSVVDTRDELSYGLEEKDLLVSILSGYPRKQGIEIAVRNMNPQYIVCDEIGDVDEASAIVESQIAGVPMIASCHGSSLFDILAHKGINMLHRSRIFDYYIGISRIATNGLNYDIHTWEEADNACKNIGWS